MEEKLCLSSFSPNLTPVPTILHAPISSTFIFCVLATLVTDHIPTINNFKNQIKYKDSFGLTHKSESEVGLCNLIILALPKMQNEIEEDFEEMPELIEVEDSDDEDSVGEIVERDEEEGLVFWML